MRIKYWKILSFFVVLFIVSVFFYCLDGMLGTNVVKVSALWAQGGDGALLFNNLDISVQLYPQPPIVINWPEIVQIEDPFEAMRLLYHASALDYTTYHVGSIDPVRQGSTWASPSLLTGLFHDDSMAGTSIPFSNTGLSVRYASGSQIAPQTQSFQGGLLNLSPTSGRSIDGFMLDYLSPVATVESIPVWSSTVVQEPWGSRFVYQGEIYPGVYSVRLEDVRDTGGYPGVMPGSSSMKDLVNLGGSYALK